MAKLRAGTPPWYSAAEQLVFASGSLGNQKRLLEIRDMKAEMQGPHRGPFSEFFSGRYA